MYIIDFIGRSLHKVQLFFYAVITALKAVCNSCAPVTDSNHSTVTVSTHKNSNKQAFRTPVARQNLFARLKGFKRPGDLYNFYVRRVRELLMKFHRLHEEPDYYSLIRQTDPGCTFREWGVSPAFHRI